MDTDWVQVPKDNLFTGYLKKQGEKGLIKSFKNRWFVLNKQQGRLNYYEKEGDASPINFITLAQISKVYPTGRDSEFALKMEDTPGSPGRIYLLHAKDKRDAENWILQIQDAKEKKPEPENTRRHTQRSSYRQSRAFPSSPLAVPGSLQGGQADEMAAQIALFKNLAAANQAAANSGTSVPEIMASSSPVSIGANPRRDSPNHRVDDMASQIEQFKNLAATNQSIASSISDVEPPMMSSSFDAPSTLHSKPQDEIPVSSSFTEDPREKQRRLMEHRAMMARKQRAKMDSRASLVDPPAPKPEIVAAAPSAVATDPVVAPSPTPTPVAAQPPILTVTPTPTVVPVAHVTSPPAAAPAHEAAPISIATTQLPAETKRPTSGPTQSPSPQSDTFGASSSESLASTPPTTPAPASEPGAAVSTPERKSAPVITTPTDVIPPVAIATEAPPAIEQQVAQPKLKAGARKRGDAVTPVPRPGSVSIAPVAPTPIVAVPQAEVTPTPAATNTGETHQQHAPSIPTNPVLVSTTNSKEPHIQPQPQQQPRASVMLGATAEMPVPAAPLAEEKPAPAASIPAITVPKIELSNETKPPKPEEKQETPPEDDASEPIIPDASFPPPPEGIKVINSVAEWKHLLLDTINGSAAEMAYLSGNIVKFVSGAGWTLISECPPPPNVIEEEDNSENEVCTWHLAPRLQVRYLGSLKQWIARELDSRIRQLGVPKWTMEWLKKVLEQPGLSVVDSAQKSAFMPFA